MVPAVSRQCGKGTDKTGFGKEPVRNVAPHNDKRRCAGTDRSQVFPNDVESVRARQAKPPPAGPDAEQRGLRRSGEAARPNAPEPADVSLVPGAASAYVGRQRILILRHRPNGPARSTTDEAPAHGANGLRRTTYKARELPASRALVGRTGGRRWRGCRGGRSSRGARVATGRGRRAVRRRAIRRRRIGGPIGGGTAPAGGTHRSTVTSTEQQPAHTHG